MSENKEASQVIAVGSDHAGFAVKEAVKKRLQERGWRVEDYTQVEAGAGDYPQVGRPVAEAVARGDFPRAVLVCGTGLGMSYVSNRVPGVRAALCFNCEFARLSREHNDSNILVIPGRVAIPDPPLAILDAWLDTPFSQDERHVRRIYQIDHPEE
ncbi:MAG: RpiB/LacA/LacB family sugar-phosphate isomerase [Planctomycetota bacterium]|jgi:ribose 5-phosphate isomerase B|nr:RpiB/LacA/LacB family sugar-phosphate isomerase [Planctomycetota bacterium]